jgi:hypothetical protein
MYSLCGAVNNQKTTSSLLNLHERRRRISPALQEVDQKASVWLRSGWNVI